ncbi:U3 small nucleolar ribonucleoprotein Mpp10 [Cordyceps militaris CM01]|uniref:U3 small nucleolar ribonucleoprotein protein MPP10 n=1 Tax=Cordyceps militaris (strain CM01) TaxID=983644 RepID=G3JRA7_CORMM|nr:U3 small nucleolar ribonucleoprotein Mpp10 [Cordyceps militaris CM01]EGX88403.1 U3 small nucleolar ribonucleoprotein Mpp10 [Cordyceps militaris CM01]
MAADSSSSLTSTSHTLTAGSNMAADSSPSKGAALALLQNLRRGNRHVFLQPTTELPTESLNLVRDTLEAFATQVGEEQERRLKESRKRKRGGEKEDILKLRKIYVDGFQTNQVWQQAKKVIGGVLEFSESLLDEMEERNEITLINGHDTGEDDDASNLSAESVEEDEADEDSENSGSDEELEDIEDPENFGQLSDTGAEELGEQEIDENAEEEEDHDEDNSEDGESFVEDPDGLNDGFFSLDDFNKQTQWFEEQDTRGDPNTDMASDDEEVDWTTDPNAPAQSSKVSTSRKTREADDEMADEDADEDEDDGPTFGDMALDAPEGDSDDEAAAYEDGFEDAENNANDIFYKDFFAPPSRKRDAKKPRKSTPKAQEPTEQDVERAMADVRRDLFDDESEMDDSEDALSDASAGDPKSRRSAHERRQAKLAEEIRKLEAASVAKREWTLSGEAKAVDRPTNSLLEQDLDFEYIGKPVPVITPEITESIDELIKRRILSQEFDEVLKRRPETETVPSGTRRGLVDVKDSKSDKSLAQIYEEEHVKNADPDNYVSQSDEKLQREEKEVESMWKEVSAKLDALSSWHYKPKPTAALLSVVADVATIAMEDAQPATAQGVAGASSRMAPQEVYKAGADTAAKGEVVSKSGLPVAREEMSREDKARRRRQHKERVRKAGNGGAGGSRAGTSKKAQTIADLKKGGVKVINRKGEITDVDGKKIKAAKTMSSGSFKL